MIVRRRGQFQVCDGNTVLSTHADFLSAEDFALHRWLGRKRKGHEDFEDELPQSDIFDGAANSARLTWRETTELVQKLIEPLPTQLIHAGVNASLPAYKTNS